MFVHPVKPIYNKNSKVLILGTFPSVKSREACFFYSHPQNRFWRVMARICKSEIPVTIEEKTALILDHNFALWDVIHSCDVTGSSDSSIKNVVPNDIKAIMDKTSVDKIFVNGKKAENLYKKYLEKDIGITAVCLPSTSPANAMWSEDRLFEYWNEKINGEK